VKHDWARLDEEYVECTRCHTWSRTRNDGECIVELPASSAPEPVPASRVLSIRQEERAKKDAEFSRRQAEAAAQQRELQLREQRIAEAKKRKEAKDTRALKRKRARRPSKIPDWGDGPIKVTDTHIDRKIPTDAVPRDQNTTKVEMPPRTPSGWFKLSDLQRALGRRR
jgi:hypothetical protein